MSSVRSLRRLRVLGLGAVVLGIGFIVGLQTTEASAYPWREGNCNGSAAIGYNFAGTGWTGTTQGYFTDGANDWDSIRKPTNGYLVSSSTGGSVEIYIDDYGAGGGGKTHCTLGVLNNITIDPSTLTSTQFKAVSSHEIGHGHGLDHTGPYDTFDGSDVPTMTAGCALDDLGLNYAHQIGPEQDDYAALTAVFYSDYHANDSFERGSSMFWGTGGGGSISIQNGGVDGGAKYARLYGYGGYMYQSVRLADIPDSSRVRLNHQKYYSASTGTISVSLYSRQLNYVTDTSTDCAGTGQYYNNWDFINSPLVSSSWTYETGVSVTPTNYWNYLNSTSAQWYDASNWDGADLRVYAYNWMKLEGASTYVRFDRIRAFD